MNGTKYKLSHLLVTALLWSGFGASSALADASVKVECWGNNCANVTLRDACNAYRQSSVPTSISCNEIASGGTTSTCASGGQTCTADTLDPLKPVGSYCEDVGGFDAIVMCR